MTIDKPRTCSRCRKPIADRSQPRKLHFAMEERPLLEGGKARMRTMFEGLYCSECGELVYEVLLGEGFVPGTSTQEAIAPPHSRKGETR